MSSAIRGLRTLAAHRSFLPLACCPIHGSDDGFSLRMGLPHQLFRFEASGGVK